MERIIVIGVLGVVHATTSAAVPEPIQQIAPTTHHACLLPFSSPGECIADGLGSHPNFFHITVCEIKPFTIYSFGSKHIVIATLCLMAVIEPCTKWNGIDDR